MLKPVLKLTKVEYMSDRVELAVAALREIWPTLGHPDFWSDAEADAALRRITQTVLAAVEESQT